MLYILKMRKMATQNSLTLMTKMTIWTICGKCLHPNGTHLHLGIQKLFWYRAKPFTYFERL